VHVMAYQRPAEFDVARVTVSVGSDGQKWSPAGAITKASDATFEWNALVLSGAIRAKARYLKLEVQHGPEASRLLLGEMWSRARPPMGLPWCSSKPARSSLPCR